MEKVYDHKSECSGCGMCKIICPHQAIEMKEDKEGFLYPVIDQKKCIDCGLCKRRCPFTHFSIGEDNNGNLKIFAVKSKDKEIRKESTSGGIFSVLSNYILKSDGTVYGAICKNVNYIMHERATSLIERNRQRDSKYVQSDIINIYDKILKDLKDGRIVFVTGTPCQTHAINEYCFNKHYSGKLYLCDIVCHGVASPLIYREHIQYLEEKNNVSIKKICFRSKDLGWSKDSKRYLKCQTVDDKIILDDLYYRLYFNYNIISRPCCEKCPYTSTTRPSDLTIGDFWGIEEIEPDFADSMGISLVVTHSEKGLMLLKQTLSDIDFCELTFSDAIKENPRLVSPTSFGKMRNEFWRLHSQWNYNRMIDFYFNDKIYWKLRRKFFRIIHYKNRGER